MKITNIACVGGEITPSLWGRVDLDKVKVGLAKCRDFIPFAHGGACFRTGTEYVATAKGECVLHAAEFSSEPSVVMEFGNLYVRFIKNRSQIMDGVNPYEVATVYGADNLKNIRMAQSIDIMFLCDGEHSPKTLSRYADTNWVFADYAFENGPFMSFNSDDTHTLTVSSYGGSTGFYGETVTVTSSKEMFTADDVGRWIKIDYTRTAKNIASGSVGFDPGMIRGPWSVDGKFLVEMRYNFTGHNPLHLEYSTDSGTTWEIYTILSEVYGYTKYECELRSEDYNNTTPQIRIKCPSTSDPGETQGYVVSQLRESRLGYIEITDFTSGTVVRGTVRRLCDCLDIPTTNWALGSWGINPGWPSVVTFHPGDRLVFGRTESEPSSLWMSCVGDYYNHEVSIEALDDEAVNIPIMSRTLDDIKAIVPLRDLLVMTTGGEWVVKGTGQNNILTPDSIYVSSQGYRGSASVDPLVAGSSVLFMQRHNSRVRDLAYTYESDGYDSQDRSIYANHLFEGYTIVDWCYQQEPFSIIWAVRSDGKLLGFTWMKEHDVWAWHLHDVGGVVESIVSIPGATADEVYMVVKRTINSVVVRYIERLTLPDEFVYVDSAKTYENITDVITGLDHLEGETVRAVADGKYVYDGLVVNNGSITIPRAADSVVVGLPYSGYIQTLPITYEADGNISTGSRRKVTELVIDVLESFGGKYGTDEDHMYEFNYDDNEMFTGVLRQNLDSGYDYYGQVTIRQDKPFPFKILTWTVGVAHGDTNRTK